MADEEERPRAPALHQIGMKLDDLSVGELDERMAQLRTEIERLEAARLAKKRALEDAGSVFRRAGPGT